MKQRNILELVVCIVMIFAITLVSACSCTESKTTPTSDATTPTVVSTNPANLAKNVPISSKITATFNKDMNPSTITTATFTLKQGTTPVSGTVTYAGKTATFTPANYLESCTIYTATITTGAKDQAGNALARDYVWNLTTPCVSGYGPGQVVQPSGGSRSEGGGDDLPTQPTIGPGLPLMVSSSFPLAGGTCVPISSKITATFNKDMNPSTINTATFTLKLGGVTPVLGTVTYAGRTATFTPAALVPFTTYTATITTGARDLDGAPLAAAIVWTFTTGPAGLPTVFFTMPACLPANSGITATFSQAMNQATITSAFTLTQAGVPVPGTVTYVGLTAIFKPSANLTNGLTYVATITTTAADLCGNHLAANTQWTFTACEADDVAPTVSSTIPVNAATCVPTNTTITVNFSEPMTPSTVSSAFTLTAPGPVNIPVTMIYAGSAAVFTPTGLLSLNTTYTATVSIAAEDLAGNAMVAPYSWTFATCASTPLGPLPVELGLARDFALLSKTGITDIPTSTIDGEVGTSPITGAAITGLTCPEVVVPHKIHTVDAAGGPWACRVIDPAPLNTAVLNMETAYTDAASRVPPTQTNFNAGNLGGQSLVPGLYKFTSAVTIPTNFTLNGGPTDVWIFQIAGNLTVGTGVQILGAAAPGNVFWQVGGLTGATLEANSRMVGTILTAKQVILRNGAQLDGRALSQTQIVLDANTVTRP